jgi:crotonobetainyl-CoA:carnitine CoA-transferase CaiB-like acyl-CoA transferase
MTPQVTASMLYGGDPIPTFTHRDMPNPLVGNYRTKDERYITLMMLQGDKFYPEFMTVIGRTDLITDERFADGHARFMNRGELIDIMDEEFASKTVDQWREILKPLSGAWAVLQKTSELCDDPAVIANGYIPTVNAMNGKPYILPTNPVQFDGHHVQPTGAPEHGQHTEEILLDAGVEWDKIEQYKQDGSIL